MVLDWLAIGIQTGFIGGLLVAFLFTFRHIALKWISVGIARFMSNLSNQAAEEGGKGATQPGAGTLTLPGGFKIDPQVIQLAVEYGPKLMELAKQFGLVKGGTGGSGGYIRP